MNNNYKVVYSGTLKAGTDVEKFVHDFMLMFKVPEAQARKLVAVGRAITLKENLDQATAEKYRVTLDKLGMPVQVEGMATMPPDLNLAPPHPMPDSVKHPQKVDAAATVRCPKCGSDRVKGDDCLACGIIISRYLEQQARRSREGLHHDNPYATPQSDLSPSHTAEPGNMTGPHSVPAGNSWQWITGGWGLFRRNPLAWIGAIVVWMILMVVVSVLPFVGSLTADLLAPVLVAGFLLGADEQRKGGHFEVSHLFAGFSNQTGGLVLVGLFYLIGTALIVGIVMLITGGTLFSMIGTLQSDNIDPQAMVTLGGSMLLALLVGMALWIPLMMAYWFAPALVALGGVTPFIAMKLSFTACLKNVLPFFVYSLIGLVLLILAIIPIGLGLFILGPVMMASMYVSYRDIFYGPH